METIYCKCGGELNVNGMNIVIDVKTQETRREEAYKCDGCNAIWSDAAVQGFAKDQKNYDK